MELIMYADDTNLFLTHKDTSYIFETANSINGLFQIYCHYM